MTIYTDSFSGYFNKKKNPYGAWGASAIPTSTGATQIVPGGARGSFYSDFSSYRRPAWTRREALPSPPAEQPAFTNEEIQKMIQRYV